VYLAIRAAEADLASIASLVFRERTYRLLANTLSLTGSVLVLSTVLAVPLAWLVARTDIRGHRLITVLATTPLAIPGFVMAHALLGIGGYDGLLARLFDVVVPRPSGLAGAAVALSLYTFPYLFLNVRSALLGLDSSLEESARSLGLGSGATFRRVVLPQLWPSMLAGWLVIALYVIGDFGAVALMRFETFSLAIYTQYTAAFNRGFASWLALILLLITLVIVVAEWRLLGGKRYARVGSGVVRPGPRLPLGRYAAPAYVYVGVAILASIGLPVLTLAAWLVLAPPSGDLIASVVATFGRTAALAAPAAAIAVLFALPVAVVSARGRYGTGRLLERIVYLGYAVPPLALALAVVMFALRYTPSLYQSAPLLVGAYVVSYLALAIGPIRSGLLQVSPRLEEAARSLGRRRSAAFIGTTLPLIGRSLLAAGALVLMVTMKELPMTYLLAPTDYSTLATRVFGYTSEGMIANAAPFAGAIVVFSCLFVGLVIAYEGRRHRPT
jgi:iron(III) transport system permease protein